MDRFDGNLLSKQKIALEVQRTIAGKTLQQIFMKCRTKEANSADTVNKAQSEATTRPDAQTGNSQTTKQPSKLERFKAMLAPLEIKHPATSEALATTDHSERPKLEKKLNLESHEQELINKFGNNNLQYVLNNAELSEILAVKDLFEKLKALDIKEEQDKGHDHEEIAKLEQRYNLHIDAINKTIDRKKCDSGDTPT